MKKARKWLSLLLALALVFTLLPQMALPARAAVTSGQCGPNLTWSLDSNTGVLTITGTGAMWDWQSPSPFEEEKKSPFANDKSISSVILPDGLTRIGSYAFYFCSSLAEVTIPPSLEEIGSSAFLGCVSPLRVNIQDLSAWFKKGSSLSGSYYLYLNGNPVTDLIVPEGMTEIPSSVFSGCKSIVNAMIPDGVDRIGSYAFQNCDNLLNVTIPASVKSIGNSAFSGCESLKSITVPEGVESIGESAFYYCKALSNITLPDSLKFIDSGAFDNTAYYDFGLWLDGLLYIGKWLIDTKGEVTAASIREGTRGIATGALNNRGALESVEIPSSVKYINDYAFRNCAKLTEVTLPDGLAIIGEDAFIGCTGLTSMTVPDSVTSIGRYAIGIASVSLVYMSSDFVVNKIPDFQIFGSKGSAAEAYANENEIAFVEIGAQSDVDRTALNAVVAAADNLQEADFTPESFAKVKEAVAAAKNLPYDADQNAVDAAAKAVNDAIAELVPTNSEAAETVALIKAIAQAETIDKNKYTEESVAMLEIVLAGAKAALGSGNPTEIGKAVQALNTALAGLKEKESDESNPFVDIKTGAFYYDAVLWAVAHDPQITNGTSATTFSPNATCTRGQVVTFLWRAAGAPEPTMTFNPFADVKEGAFYYKAVLWALQNGITNGVDATHFGSDQGCTRGQVVTFLHRAQGTPAPGSDVNPFGDVAAGAFYYDAVLWAVNHDPQITNGTSATTFSPNATCTRGQIVTFLYRSMK